MKSMIVKLHPSFLSRLEGKKDTLRRGLTAYRYGSTRRDYIRIENHKTIDKLHKYNDILNEYRHAQHLDL